MVYRHANKTQRYDDSYNSNHMLNLITTSPGKRRSQRRRAYERFKEGIEEIPVEGSIRRQLYDEREAARAERYVPSDPYFAKAVAFLSAMAVAGAGTAVGYVALKTLDHLLDDHNLNPIGDVLGEEPIHKETKTRAASIDVITPKATKISGDDESAYNPVAVNENKVAYQNSDGVVIKNKEGSDRINFSGKDPSSDGRYVVFQCINNKVYDLDTKTEKVIMEDTNGNLESPRISKGKSVTELINHDDKVQDIYETDVETKETKLVAKNATMPDIFYDGDIHKVVYVSLGDYKVYVKDIKTGNVERVNPDSDEDEDFPSIYGDNVVFDAGNIYLKNIKTGELKDLGKGANPSIHKNLVAWNADNDIFVYNILDDKTTQLKLDKMQISPSIFDGDTTDYVVFTQQETGFDDPSVWLVDLTENHAPDLEQILSQKVANGAGWSGKVVASDQDGDTLTKIIQGDAFQLAGDTVSLKDSYKSLPGTYMCKVTATDEHGAAKNMLFNITVDENDVITNTPPSVRNLKDITIPYGDISKASGTLEVFDPDGDTVSLSLFNGSSNYFNLIGNQWSLKQEYLTKPGTYPLEVRASDGKETKDTSVLVTVKDNKTEQDKPIWKSPYVIVCGSGIGVGGILTTVGGTALIVRKLTKKKTSV